MKLTLATAFCVLTINSVNAFAPSTQVGSTFVGSVQLQSRNVAGEWKGQQTLNISRSCKISCIRRVKYMCEIQRSCNIMDKRFSSKCPPTSDAMTLWKISQNALEVYWRRTHWAHMDVILVCFSHTCFSSFLSWDQDTRNHHWAFHGWSPCSSNWNGNHFLSRKHSRGGNRKFEGGKMWNWI